jgi:hypothetical protein
VRIRGGFAAALCLAWLLGGCGKFQTAHECGSFVSTIKAWQSRSLAAPSAKPSALSPAAESRILADRYDQLADTIDALHLKSPELVPRAERYQKLAREAAAALRDVADAVERSNPERARQRRVAFDDIARGEGPLVADINGICR